MVTKNLARQKVIVMIYSKTMLNKNLERYLSSRERIWGPHRRVGKEKLPLINSARLNPTRILLLLRLLCVLVK